MNESDRTILEDSRKKIDALIGRLGLVDDYKINHAQRVLLIVSDFLEKCEEEITI
jgi:hypothetical protein